MSEYAKNSTNKNPARIATTPAFDRHPTTSPVSPTISAHRHDVMKSAADRPIRTDGRQIGRALKRSIIPSCRSVERPTAVPITDVTRFSAKIPPNR